MRLEIVILVDNAEEVAQPLLVELACPVPEDRLAIVTSCGFESSSYSELPNTPG